MRLYACPCVHRALLASSSLEQDWASAGQAAWVSEVDQHGIPGRHTGRSTDRPCPTSVGMVPSARKAAARFP